MRVALTYFKPTSGKLYSAGEYDSQCEHVFEIFQEVATMARERRLPGLVDGHSEFIVHVDPVEHKHRHIGLVIPDSAVRS